MKKLFWSVPLVLFLSSANLMGAMIILGENEVSPVDAPYVSTEVLSPTGYDGSKLHDLDSGTFASVRDDTLTGTSTATTPDYAAAPTTGHVVFDLGEVMAIDGVTLYSRLIDNPGSYLPKVVDFFYYVDGTPTGNAIVDDIENDEDITLIATATVAPVTNGATWSTTWNAVESRYIGMRITGAYSDTASQTNFNTQIAEVVFSKAAVDVPEPSSIALLLTFTLGLLALPRLARRGKK